MTAAFARPPLKNSGIPMAEPPLGFRPNFAAAKSSDCTPDSNCDGFGDCDCQSACDCQQDCACQPDGDGDS